MLKLLENMRRQIITYLEAAKQSRTRDKRIQLIVKRMLKRHPKRRKRSGKAKRAGTKREKAK